MLGAHSIDGPHLGDPQALYAETFPPHLTIGAQSDVTDWEETLAGSQRQCQMFQALHVELGQCRLYTAQPLKFLLLILWSCPWPMWPYNHGPSSSIPPRREAPKVPWMTGWKALPGPVLAPQGTVMSTESLTLMLASTGTSDRWIWFCPYRPVPTFPPQRLKVTFLVGENTRGSF